MKELKFKGENLTAGELKEIADNFSITFHGESRRKERQLGKSEILEILKNPLLAYWNTDDTVNVAKDKFNYLVFGWNIEKQKWDVITYKEKSHNDKDIFEKQKLARLGKDRQQKKKNPYITDTISKLQDVFGNFKLKI